MAAAHPRSHPRIGLATAVQLIAEVSRTESRSQMLDHVVQSGAQNADLGEHAWRRPTSTAPSGRNDRTVAKFRVTFLRPLRDAMGRNPTHRHVTHKTSSPTRGVAYEVPERSRTSFVCK